MKTFHALAAACCALLVLAVAPALARQGEKPTLAIRTITATPAVLAQADAQGQRATLEQILQGADSLLTTAITRSRRFDIVARSALPDILKEHDIQISGDSSMSDPRTSQAYKLAGAQYVAEVVADNFQDAVVSAEVDGQFGRTSAARRTIQLQASLRVWETATTKLKETVTIRLEKSAVNEILPGASQDGRMTNALIGEVTDAFSAESATALMNYLAPAKVAAYTLGIITFTRGEGTGVAEGQYWEVLHAGAPIVDPDTGETLGNNEVHIGWARVSDVSEKFSKAHALQDFGINIGDIMRPARNGLPAGVDPEARVTGSAPPRPATPASPDRPSNP